MTTTPAEPKHSFEGAGNLRRCSRCRAYRWNRPAGVVYGPAVDGPWDKNPPSECNLTVDAILHTGPSDWMGIDTVLLDVETTGLDHAVDKIIEIAAVRGSYSGKDFVIQDVACHVIDPGISISEEITHLTGIKPSDVRGAPTFAEVAEEVLSMMVGCRFAVAYNAPFDQGFILSECVRARMIPPKCLSGRSAAIIDPLVWGRWKAKGYGKGANKLGPMAARLHLEVPQDLHRADVDAILAGNVLGALSHHLPKRLADVMDLQTILRAEQDADYHQYRLRKRAEEAYAKEQQS